MKRFLFAIIGLLLLLDFSSCRRHRSCELTEENKGDSGIIETDSIERTDSLKVSAELHIPTINSDTAQQILNRENYISSYNHETRCPNWVAWELTRESSQGQIGKRIWYDENGKVIGIPNYRLEYVSGAYIYDAEIEEPRPEFADWNLMSADMSHGHMCPAADSKTSKAAMNQSFLLTNLCVQARNLNTGSWKKLEDSCRSWAMKHGRIYIVAGPIFRNGKASHWMGKIAVPDAFFKVILCQNGVPKSIAFVFSNNNKKHSRDESICSVDVVEYLTGIDFFTHLPDEIEEVVESQTDYDAW